MYVSVAMIRFPGEKNMEKEREKEEENKEKKKMMKWEQEHIHMRTNRTSMKTSQMKN